MSFLLHSFGITASCCNNYLPKNNYNSSYIFLRVLFALQSKHCTCKAIIAEFASQSNYGVKKPLRKAKRRKRTDQSLFRY